MILGNRLAVSIPQNQTGCLKAWPVKGLILRTSDLQWGPSQVKIWIYFGVPCQDIHAGAAYVTLELEFQHLSVNKSFSRRASFIILFILMWVITVGVVPSLQYIYLIRKILTSGTQRWLTNKTTNTLRSQKLCNHRSKQKNRALA